VVEAATENPTSSSTSSRTWIGWPQGRDPRVQHLVDLDHRNRQADPAADRIIGMHFMNPVPVMKLVEVIRGRETSDDTVKRTVAIVQALGKTADVVNDSPGFVSNRVLMPMINEAIFCVDEGVATAEAVDQVMSSA